MRLQPDRKRIRGVPGVRNRSEAAMIRKVVIVVLTLGAAGVTLLWLASTARAVYWGRSVTSRCSLYMSVDNGIAEVVVWRLRDGQHATGQTSFCLGDFSYSTGPPDPASPATRIGVGAVRNVERRYGCGPSTNGKRETIVATTAAVPLWALLVLLSIYPAYVFLREPLRHWRRSRKGLCVKCGYDLTGNVSGTCPECGTEVKQP
jgi:hypothetical protein